MRGRETERARDFAIDDADDRNLLSLAFFTDDRTFYFIFIFYLSFVVVVSPVVVSLFVSCFSFGCCTCFIYFALACTFAVLYFFFSFCLF